MKAVSMAKDGLKQAIRSLYPVPISDAEAQEAADNLLGFVGLLIEIDREQKAAPTPKNEARPCR